MNLRQKCKKLKKENERLQKYIPGYPSPIVHVDHYQMVTLMGKRKMLAKEWCDLELYREEIIDSMYGDFVESIKPYVKLKQYRDMTDGRVVIEGRVKVCKQNQGGCCE